MNFEFQLTPPGTKVDGPNPTRYNCSSYGRCCTPWWWSGPTLNLTASHTLEKSDSKWIGKDKASAKNQSTKAPTSHNGDFVLDSYIRKVGSTSF